MKKTNKTNQEERRRDIERPIPGRLYLAVLPFILYTWPRDKVGHSEQVYVKAEEVLMFVETKYVERAGPKDSPILCDFYLYNGNVYIASNGPNQRPSRYLTEAPLKRHNK